MNKLLRAVLARGGICVRTAKILMPAQDEDAWEGFKKRDGQLWGGG